MTGLIRNNFNEEVMVELSWIMNAIDAIAQKSGVETYEILLIRYRIQPEEEKAIDKFFVFNFAKLGSMSIAEIQQKIAYEYFQLTNRTWSRPNDVVKTLIKAKCEQGDFGKVSN